MPALAREVKKAGNERHDKRYDPTTVRNLVLRTKHFLDFLRNRKSGNLSTNSCRGTIPEETCIAVRQRAKKGQ